MEQVSGWSEQGGTSIVIPGTQGSGTQRFQQSFRSATITVRDSSNNLATIYSDDLASPTAKANPFTASSTTGSWSFFTTTGTYSITFSGGSITAPFSITVNVGLGNAGGIPSYAYASLPTSKTQNAGDIARVTDTSRGLWMDTGVQWSSISGRVFDVSQFGAKGDGVTNDAVAIQAALDAAVNASGYSGIVFFPQTGNFYNIGTTALTVNGHGICIEGNSVAIQYTGTGIALDIVPTAAPVFRNQFTVRGLNIACTGAGATCVRWRASHGQAYNMQLSVQGANGIGLDLSGVGSVGTGPYYNSFYDLRAQGTSGAGQYGIKFTQDPSTTHKPNANQFFGGRVGQFGHGVFVLGAGNRMFGLTTEACTTHYEIDESQDFAVYSPYLESGTTGFLVNASSNRATIEFPYSTGVSSTLTDNGVETTFMLRGTTAQNFSWPVQAGRYTPTPTNDTNVAAFSVSDLHYLRVGNSVTVFGKIGVDPTAAGGASTIFLLSLPVTPAFTTNGQCAGSCGNQACTEIGIVNSDAATEQAVIFFLAQNAALHDIWMHFTYTIAN